MIIYLGCRSPDTSCNLPGNIGRAALKRFSIWFCTRWGLPCQPCRHGSGELLPRHFTLTRQVPGGIFSVALSSGHPKFALRTTVPFGVRTFLPGVCRSDHAPTPFLNFKIFSDDKNAMENFIFRQSPCSPIHPPCCFATEGHVEYPSGRIFSTGP